MSKEQTNQIIARFRHDEYRPATRKWNAANPATRALRAGVLANRLERGILPSYALDATSEHVERAIRVLARFAKVYA